MAPAQAKPQWAEALNQEYKQVLIQLNSEYGTTGNTFTEVIRQRDAKNPNKTAQLEVVAQAFLKKWIGKKWHQMSVFDKTSAFRLDIFKMAGEIRKTLNKMMDSLEKEMNVEALGVLINDVNRQIMSMRSLMRALHMALPEPKKPKALKR